MAVAAAADEYTESSAAAAASLLDAAAASCDGERHLRHKMVTAGAAPPSCQPSWQFFYTCTIPSTCIRYGMYANTKYAFVKLRKLIVLHVYKLVP